MLTASRWAVEQKASAWHHAELEELLWMLDWILDQLLELPLDIGRTSVIAEGVDLPFAYLKPEALAYIIKGVFL